MKILNALLFSSTLWLANMAYSLPPPSDTKPLQNLPVEKSLVVMPGKFAELNLTMSKNSEVNVTFEANEELEWNVHSHKDNKTLIHKNGYTKKSQESFKAESDGVFSYLWKNNLKAPATLKVTLNLDKDSTIHSWHGDAK